MSHGSLGEWSECNALFETVRVANGVYFCMSKLVNEKTVSANMCACLYARARVCVCVCVCVCVASIRNDELG